MLVRENHPRQEAYLKRVLNKDQYHDIRIIEPCIVESAFDKKVYQFVVVDSKGISLEGCVPMKVIHFSDVTSIDMNPKKPKFLKGREQEDARHVEVKYKTNKKLNKEVEKELNKFIKKIKTKSKKKERNSSDNILTTEQIPQENNRSSIDNQLGKSRDKSSRINILEETMQSGDNEEIDEITNNQKRSPTDRYVLINLPTKPKTHSRALSLNSKYEEPQIVDALKHCLILDIHQKDKSIDIMINKSTDIVDIKSGVIGIQGNIFNQYIGREEFDDFILLKLEKSNRSCLDEEVMDIYFFNDRSHFYVILKQAWMNYKLRTTSEEERIMFMDEPDDCTITEQMFVNLKTELLANLTQDRSLSLEDLEMCKLFLKLGLAFRRIFWKDGLLFSSLTTRLKILTSKVMEDIKSKQFDAAEMSNAFASSLIVMEILCLSLRETEIFKGRMSHVTGSKGRDLLVIAEFILAEMNLSGDDDISEEASPHHNHSIIQLN